MGIKKSVFTSSCLSYDGMFLLECSADSDCEGTGTCNGGVCSNGR